MRVRALLVRILRQFLRDRRTLALMIAAPILILTLVYYVFNGDTYRPKLGTVAVPDLVASRLAEGGAELTVYTDPVGALADLQSQKVDAVFQFQNGVPHIRLEGSDPSKNRAVILLVQQVLQGTVPAAGLADASATLSGGPASGQGSSLSRPVFDYLHGSADMRSFDNFGPVLIGVFAFFFVFLIAGISFLKERTSGTLERLLATPLRRWEVVAGYMAGFGIFTMLQAVLIAWYAIQVLGMLMVGSFGYVLLITLLLSMTALSFGTFLSAYANTEFQLIQFIPLVITPQVFFSGLFAMDTISPWLRWLSYLMPLKYGADAMRDIMIRGEGWSAIAPDAAVLLGLSIVFMAANVFALRKHRRI